MWPSHAIFLEEVQLHHYSTRAHHIQKTFLQMETPILYVLDNNGWEPANLWTKGFKPWSLFLYILLHRLPNSSDILVCIPEPPYNVQGNIYLGIFYILTIQQFPCKITPWLDPDFLTLYVNRSGNVLGPVCVCGFVEATLCTTATIQSYVVHHHKASIKMVAH